MTTIRLSQVRQAISHFLTGPVVQLLARTPVTPSTLTFLGFAVTVGAAILIATDYLLIAGLVVLVAGLFDMLDGALARRTNQATRFGAVLDSTLDRLSEGALLLGILFLFAGEGSTIGILLAGGVLTTSMLVSYIRARAEALGIECTTGLFTRPERVIVLVLGLMLNRIEIALAIMITFSLFTIGQRLTLVWRYTRNG
jgi:CDP-diacylglycerol--glycerol-3-phosphate 3-phosphatidyltransferase